MIIDASAIVAILREEPEADWLLSKITKAETLGVGAPTVAETGLVLMGRLGVSGRTLLARFLEESDTDVIPFDTAHCSAALDAFSRYGKGKHPAALNFGDCLTYATSYIAEEPLLCIGDDFAQTDLPLVR